jgi:uncharacterized protein (DUF1330 family)
MRAKYKLSIALVLGAAVGALAMQVLHAQTKPPVYFIGENDVSDADAYTKEYLSLAQPLIKKGGGVYIAAGKPTSFDGEPPKARVIIIRWDSMEQLQTWFNSPEYRAARKVGDKYTKFRTFAVDGVPQK